MSRIRTIRLEQIIICLMVLIHIPVLFAYQARYGSGFSDRQLWLMIGLVVVLGAAACFWPGQWLGGFTRWLGSIVNTPNRRILGLCLFIFALLFLYSFVRPVVIYDEPCDLYASQIVANEGYRSLFIRYDEIAWLGSQHPPLAPILHGTVMMIFGQNPMIIRWVTAAFSVATCFVIYLVGKQVFDERVGLFAALACAFSIQFYRSGVLANNDMLVVFFFALSLLLFIRLLDVPSFGMGLATGVAITLGLLSKYTMVFVFPIMLGWLIVSRPSKRIWLYLGGSFALVAVATIVWCFYLSDTGGLSRQIQRIAFYMSRASHYSFRQIDNLLVELAAALGMFVFPLLVWGSFTRLKNWRNFDWFLLVWIAGVFLPVALTLPVARYMLAMFPAVAIIVGFGITQLGERRAWIATLALVMAAEILIAHGIAEYERSPILLWFPSAQANAGAMCLSAPKI